MFHDERPGRGLGPEFDGGRGGGRWRRPGFRGRGPGGPGFDHLMGRGPMVRRGDVRTAILTLLAEEPMHGYQIIGELNERSGGMWRASAGSVYPTLQQLEDEGLVTSEPREGRKVYVLTEDGKALAARSSAERAPWDMPGSSEAADLRDLLTQLGAAVWQVSHVGSAASVARAGAILTEARRSLYRLLAEDERPDAATTSGTASDPSREDGR